MSAVGQGEGAMDVREVTVECRKMVSDGAYGNETYTVIFKAVAPEGDTRGWALETAESLAEEAYALVVDRLKQSISAGIRESLETRQEREARWDRERAELRAGQPE